MSLSRCASTDTELQREISKGGENKKKWREEVEREKDGTEDKMGIKGRTGRQNIRM